LYHSIKTARDVQLTILGFISLLLTPLVVTVCSVVYNYPFPDSISLTGTMANTASFILPFCLGMLAIFAVNYGLIHNHNLAERVLLFIMAIGFTAVALQPCYSQYVTLEYVGALHLTRATSNYIHSLGATLGFGSMIIWITCFFTMSDKPRHKQTAEKRLRNLVYVVSGLISSISLTTSLFERYIRFEHNAPTVLISEFVILTFCGISILIKGGHFLGDS